MTPPNQVLQADNPAEKLCGLLLEIAGRDTNRLPSVIRHARVLDTALPHMTTSQAEVARARINRLQTKWGPLLPDDSNEPETDGIPPETRVVGWLSQRRHPTKYLKVIHNAAKAVAAGETSLSLILDRAYVGESSVFYCWVGLDSFREWLLQLRVARRQKKAVYRPGSLCQWWIDEMHPGGGKSSAYAACLKQLEQCRWPSQP